MKRKEKKIQNVVGEESDENGEGNKIEVVWKTNRKGDEACGKENENKDKQRSGENNNEKII